jgi:hypothetical protein
MTTEAVVQGQLEAYNARDLNKFLGFFAEDVQVTRMPNLEPSLTGKAALAEFYANNRFHLPNLAAKLVGRLVMGNKVFDHEQIFGVQTTPFEIVVVYEVENGLIARMWSFNP